MQTEDNDKETVIESLAAPEGGQPEDRGDNFIGGDEDVVQPVEGKATEEKPGLPKPEEKPDDKAEPRIPKSRFDEVNARMKDAEAARIALEAEVAELRKAKEPPKPQEKKAPEVDLDAREEEYAQAVASGNAKGAAAIRREINAEIKRQAVQEAETSVRESLNKRDAETALDGVINASLEKYPFLDDRSADANKEAIAEVVEWRDFYVSKGIPLHEALQKAVAKIGPGYAKAEPEGDDKPDATEDKNNVRRIDALRKNAAAQNAQPPQLNGVGERASAGGRVDVSKMTDDDFNALPAAEKKRLRGD